MKSLSITLNCCALKSPMAPPASELRPAVEEVYLAVGSPPTHHAVATRFECPNCGESILKIQRGISIDRPADMWGEG